MLTCDCCPHKLPLGLEGFDRFERDGREQHVTEAVLHDRQPLLVDATVPSRFALARLAARHHAAHLLDGVALELQHFLLSVPAKTLQCAMHLADGQPVIAGVVKICGDAVRVRAKSGYKLHSARSTVRK
jgi:hypothetical protein